jgi:hypothetical protein
MGLSVGQNDTVLERRRMEDCAISHDYDAHIWQAQTSIYTYVVLEMLIPEMFSVSYNKTVHVLYER